MRVLPAGLVLLLVTSTPGAAQVTDAEVTRLLRAAFQPALPFPEAEPDGTAPGGAADPVWTVRWPDPGSLQIEVLANPLNRGNRERALEIEKQVQTAAMASQRQSQADYERALSDFQRTGKVSEIREISLRDDGLAGERYDAESQLTIRAGLFDDRYAVSVATSRLPEVRPASAGPALVIRLAANTYLQAATADDPAAARFCPEQAWVFFGTSASPVVTWEGESAVAVSVARSGAGGSRGLVVSLGGNVELVDRVLREANWAALAARFGG